MSLAALKQFKISPESHSTAYKQKISHALSTDRVLPCRLLAPPSLISNCPMRFLEVAGITRNIYPKLAIILSSGVAGSIQGSDLRLLELQHNGNSPQVLTGPGI